MDIPAESVIENLLEMIKTMARESAMNAARVDALRLRVSELESELKFFDDKRPEKVDEE